MPSKRRCEACDLESEKYGEVLRCECCPFVFHATCAGYCKCANCSYVSNPVPRKTPCVRCSPQKLTSLAQTLRVLGSLTFTSLFSLIFLIFSYKTQLRRTICLLLGSAGAVLEELNTGSTLPAPCKSRRKKKTTKSALSLSLRMIPANSFTKL